MPFEPTFVDLVRNFTTTTGTNNFVLGAAVNGFTSFASALQPGDSFYYSAIGVEKPAEREVGRGTLQSNGTISREPISGPKTNFSSGTKTVSLIAAAEWFSSMQAGGGSAGAAAAATKAALASASTQLPVLLTETGCEGVFVFDPANLSAAVASDPRKAIYVAPASDSTGASGAWVRKYSGPKSASWFGAKGDGSTDDAAALQAWLDSGGHLYLPAGEYFSPATLILRRYAVIDGEGYGFDNRIVDGSVTTGYENQRGSRIKFPAGVRGLDIQPQTSQTDETAAIVATQEGAMHSCISNLALVGPGTGASATGVYCRTVIHLQNVHVLKFQGKGFDISAVLGPGSDATAEYGNSSNSTLKSCWAIYNGSHGFHIRGADANVIKLDTCQSQLNGGWGYLDEGLIGNTYVSCHAATNSSGSFKASSSHVFIGCYVETGTGENCDLPGYPDGGNVVVGGNLSYYAINNNASANKSVAINNQESMFNMVSSRGPHSSPTAPISNAAYFYHHATGGLVLYGEGSADDFTILNKSGATALRIPTGTMNAVFGGSLQAAGLITTNGQVKDGSGNNIINKIAGDATYYYTNSGAHIWMDGAPSPIATLSNAALDLWTGQAIKISNVQIIDGSRNIVNAGSGAFSGALTSSGGTIGYAAGAGGAATQATNKSTGVTLNKQCGQVTLSAAALAANTTVSFTLTNNQIGATDLLILNHASGGTVGAYALNCQCSAGSAVINVRNVTAASLSEAIVIRFAVIKAVTA